MGIRMRGSLKIPVLREGSPKPVYRENCLKMGTWTVCGFKGRGGRGLAKKREWCFRARVDTPMHTMSQ